MSYFEPLLTRCRAYSVIVALLGLLPCIAAGLDLTPTTDFRDLEGFKIPVLRFSDGARSVIYQPPLGWKVTGGGALLSLFPDDRSDVLMEMRVIPIKDQEPTARGDLGKWCAGFLPKDAASSGDTVEAVSPFTLRGLGSREFTFSYVSQGIRFSKAVAVVNLSFQERLVIVLTAKTRDFPPAHEEALRSLFTMNWQS